MKIDTGIEAKDRKELAEGLSTLLADSYTLYVKTQNYHWNVTGPMFRSLHMMFEEEYTELAAAVDEIAERIRALGHYAPGGFAAFQKRSNVGDAPEKVPSATEMIRDLVEGNETVVRTARKVLSTAEDAGDEGTADLATQRLRVHEKAAWMLRSLVQNEEGSSSKASA